MSLNYWDLDSIRDRMKNYDIKYMEIYDEIFDHISSAIEEKQNEGDTRKIPVIFDEVVEIHFGGYQGVEQLAKTQEADYRQKIRKRIWANFMHYINFNSFIFTVLLVLLSLMIPAGKLTFGVIACMLFITAYSPALYVYFKLRRIKPTGEKKSLVYSQTIRRANLPALLFYWALWIPRLPYLIMDKDMPYKLYNIQPAILAFLLALMLIYNFSCIRLCKQELEQISFAKN